MDPKVAPPDLLAARLAARQHGVVTSWQLRDCGLGATAVRNRLRSGRLHRMHRGVYAVGHTAPSAARRWMAAVLAHSSRRALSERSVALSHRSAAALWGLLDEARGPVHVSARGRGGRARRPGIAIHRPVELGPDAIGVRDGIPATTIPRTIEDLRRREPARVVRRAIRQAAVLGVDLTTGDLTTGEDGTRSELEWQFLRLCQRHRLPRPEVNARIERFVVDFLWAERMVIVETDGYRFHRGRAAFEDDRDRDLALRSLGYEVIRLSYRQVTEEPRRVASVLRGAVGASSES